MKLAIISDIHGNIEALTAVLKDIEARGILDKDIVCLGDVVGYGPNPRECLKKAMDFRLTLMGNHEEALLFYPEDFNEKARQAIDWTKEQINSEAEGRDIKFELWNFLDSMARSAPLTKKITVVHASPRQPTREYVMPKDVEDEGRMKAIFGHQMTPLCFCGHTHFAGVFCEDITFQTPLQLGFTYEMDESKALINVGSVGQPRDGDPRSSYVTLEDGRIDFHRVEYDFTETQKKIAKIEALPNFLAARLAKGR